MPSIQEENLIFHFPNGWQVTKFDGWGFYRNQFQKVCGAAKAVDIFAVSPDHCVWAIEVKDYRLYRRTKSIDLAMEVACKVRDSLAAVFAAHKNANDAGERQLAWSVLRSSSIRVVLHLEQPAQHSKLFQRSIDPARVKQNLKQLLKAIDPHPQVLEMGNLGSVAWSVT